MLSSDMQSCTKKANVMYTGQGNKEQVSQDLKDGFSYLYTYYSFTYAYNNSTIQQLLNPKLNNYAL